MVEARREPRLPHEALAERLVVGEPGRQHLERDRTLEPRIERPEDLPHPAASDQPLDRVAGDDRRGRVVGLAHRAIVLLVTRECDGRARIAAIASRSAQRSMTPVYVVAPSSTLFVKTT